MKLAISPCLLATPLIRRFIIMICFAASTGLSTCCILISYWDGADLLHHAIEGQVLEFAGQPQFLEQRLVMVQYIQPVGVAAYREYPGMEGRYVPAVTRPSAPG